MSLFLVELSNKTLDFCRSHKDELHAKLAGTILVTPLVFDKFMTSTVAFFGKVGFSEDSMNALQASMHKKVGNPRYSTCVHFKGIFAKFFHWR